MYMYIYSRQSNYTVTLTAEFHVAVVSLSGRDVAPRSFGIVVRVPAIILCFPHRPFYEVQVPAR